ncbi:MAG: Rieske (2Fe-2S) protein [Acidobacteriia bacterium]|nr:Rieske (2Fe-2S) protein [Terriglobia bacterium]
MSESSSSLNSSERRSFLGKLTGMIAAAIAAFLGVVAGRFTLSPAFQKPDEEGSWQIVGPVEEIPEHVPTKQSIVVSQPAGWGRFNSQQLLWVVRDDSNLKVFSATCPHLGCTVNVAASGFVCPCHGSAWDANGQRVGGPALRGLDTLNTRIEDGILKVEYQHFKQGIATKEVVS